MVPNSYGPPPNSSRRPRPLAIRSLFGRNTLEAWIWVVALVSMAFLDPAGPRHFTLCPLANLHIPICPGCGLGHSISYFLHGEIWRSMAVHPLGIPAVFILATRIRTLFKINLMNYGESH